MNYRPYQPWIRAFFGVGVMVVLLIPAVSADELATTDERQTTSIKEDANSSSLDESKGARAATETDSKRHTYTLGELSGIYGANASLTFRWYRDIDNQDSKEDFLKWALQEKASLWTVFGWNGWRGYIKGSMSNVDRGVGSTYTGIGADVEGPVLDLAFVTHDFLMPSGHPLKFTLGRQVQFVGRGLTYYAVSDGVQIEYSENAWSQKYFAAKTLPRQDNIDFSVPGFDKEGDRYFYGGEWSYSGIPRLSLYGYVFGQEDEASENPDNIAQAYRYDSFYYGSGFAAKPFGQLQLWGEIVAETGEGYTDADRSGGPQETDVSAWAWILGGRHAWNAPTQPVIEAEAAYGSGDPDRILVTNTVNGSADVRDTNFLYFGYYAAGYALQPRLSNLYIYSAGFNFQPLEKILAFERFLIGGKTYWYFKDEKDGGTSDFESAGHSDDLGNEWDAYIHWEIRPDLLWSIRYGIFLPQGGFPNDFREPTQFFFTRLSWDY